MFLALAAPGQTIMKLADTKASEACTPGTFTQRIDNGVHDQEQESDGGMADNSSDLELMHESGSSDEQKIVLHFHDITIPQGATIDSVHIQFQKDSNGETRPCDAIFYAEDVDNASTLTGSLADNWIDNLANVTTAEVTWAIPSWSGDNVGDQGANQRTIDISAVIQEIVNRPGWSEGNDINILIKTGPNKGEAEAKSYDGDDTGAPEIYIEYCY